MVGCQTTTRNAHCRPPKARKLVTAAKEAGAVGCAGRLRAPSTAGSWQLGDIVLDALLAQHLAQQVVLIVAPVDEAAAVLCVVCAYPLEVVGACPCCTLRSEVAANQRVIDAALRMSEIAARLIWPGGETY